MKRGDRPSEQEAVRTTIVGGRPPGSGKAVGPIPRGIEVLVKKAAVDPDFKQILMEKRAKAADEINLKLEPAEIAMLTAGPAAQRAKLIANTVVADLSRAAFLGRAAAVMLAALGVSVQGCSRTEVTDGVRPDRPQPACKGVEPDKPDPKAEPKAEPKPEPTRPDVPATEGIRPDRPTPKPEPEPTKPNPEPATKSTKPDQSSVEDQFPGITGIRPAKISPKEVVQRKVEQLGSQNPRTRQWAKQTLLRADPSIVPLLKDAKAPNADAEKEPRNIIEALKAKTTK